MFVFEIGMSNCGQIMGALNANSKLTRRSVGATGDNTQNPPSAGWFGSVPKPLGGAEMPDGVIDPMLSARLQ